MHRDVRLPALICVDSRELVGNPICEPVFVTGAEPGDTLQVEVLDLRTAQFGWTCVRPGGTLLEKPLRWFLGDDPTFDDPGAPDGVDSPRGQSHDIAAR